jgi:ABC-type transport system involved in cytochrome bd biosynthesis fused ATPase/permease subunit
MPSIRERRSDEKCASGAMSGRLPALLVRDLSVAFPGSGGAVRPAVDRISFDIKPGETVALVGESGSGKSVSALSVLQAAALPGGQSSLRSILFKGQELLSAPERDAGGARQRHHDDLPGADDLAQSAAHGGEAGRRGAAPASGPER